MLCNARLTFHESPAVPAVALHGVPVLRSDLAHVLVVVAAAAQRMLVKTASHTKCDWLNAIVSGGANPHPGLNTRCHTALRLAAAGDPAIRPLGWVVLRFDDTVQCMFTAGQKSHLR